MTRRTTTRVLTVIILVGLILLSCGCWMRRAHSKQSGSNIGPGEIRPEPGAELWIDRDSTMMSVQGTTLTAIGHRKILAGSSGSVVAKGAKIRVIEPDDVPNPEVARTDALGDRNPWFAVRVIDSPVAEQKGWAGWMHNSAFSHTKVEPDPVEGSHLVTQRAALCPNGEALGVDCKQDVPRDIRVRVYRCTDIAAAVEFWDEKGHYHTGWVDLARFEDDPCPD